MNTQSLYKLSYGLYLITSQYKEKIGGCTVNTVMQVTAEEPPKLTVTVNKENYTHVLIEKSKKVNVSVLAQDAPFLLIARFGFRTSLEYDKFKETEYITGKNNIPIITDHTVSYIECNVINQIDAGTHSIFVLEAVEADILSQKPAMTYEYYHTVLKGKTPPKASSYGI